MGPVQDNSNEYLKQKFHYILPTVSLKKQQQSKQIQHQLYGLYLQKWKWAQAQVKKGKHNIGHEIYTTSGNT